MPGGDAVEDGEGLDVDEAARIDGAAGELVGGERIERATVVALTSILATSKVRSTGGLKLAMRKPW